MKKGKSIILPIGIILLLVVFCFSAYQIISYYKEASRTESIYNELRDKISADDDSVLTDDGDNAGPPSIQKKYRDIYALNTDFWGWIQIDGTPIDYPVMHTPSDSEYYLRRAFDKSYLVSGTPFLDGRCHEGCGNLIVYGHHMKNKSMFGTLPEYASEKYWKEHRIIKLDTLYDSYEYEVVAAFYSKVYRQGEDGFYYYNYTDLTDPDRFNEFVYGVKKVSVYKYDFPVEYGDQFLTLSTCSYHTSDGRFVVVAKKCN